MKLVSNDQYKSKFSPSQLKKSNPTIPWNFVDPQPKSASPIGVVLGFREATTKTINALIRLSRMGYKEIYASQDKIAEIAKLNVSTVNEEIKYLKELGYIEKLYRGVRQTCWYKVSTWFNNQEVQQALKTKLPIFFFTANMMLSVVCEPPRLSNNVLTVIYKSLTVDSNIKRVYPRKEENQKEILKEKGSPPITVVKKSSRTISEIKIEIDKVNYLLQVMRSMGAIRSIDQYEQRLRNLVIELKEVRE